MSDNEKIEGDQANNAASQMVAKICKSCCSWACCSWDCLTPIFKHYRVIGATGGILAILCVLWATLDASVSKWLLAFWSVTPPVWFFFEFHWAKNTTCENKPDLVDIRESQEFAQKIWAGVVVALTVLFLK